LQKIFSDQKYAMGMSNSLNLKQMSDIDVKFSNVFVGKTRFLSIKVAGAEYFLMCHDPINGFSAGLLMGLKIAGFEAILTLKNCLDLKVFDERFSDIDLELLPEDVRADIATLVFKNLLAELSSKLKLDIAIASVLFSAQGDKSFDHTIGWSVYDQTSAVIVCGNLQLGGELFARIVDEFEKIPAAAKSMDTDVSFDVFLEAGRTKLSGLAFDSLEIGDIIFLDDDSQLRSGTFALHGIDSPKITGKFEKSSFKVSNVVESV
jgi:hypothetical protein